MAERWVLAGGSGLVGRALAQELAAEGATVVILSRRAAPSGDAGETEGSLSGSVGRGAGGPEAQGGAAGTIRVVHWDPADSRRPWAAEMAGATAVVNLAGESLGRWPWTPARRQRLRDSRLVATRGLVAAMEDLPPDLRPSVLLSASGADYYEGLDEEPATEATPPAATFLARLCRDWEAEARQAEELGVRVVILRLGIVIAPAAPAVLRLALPVRLFLGGPIGSGRQWVSWIDRRDVVGLARWAAARADIAGPLNAVAPDPRPQLEVTRILARLLGRPVWFPTPAWAVRLALGGQAVLVLGSRRVWPARALAAGYVFRRPRLEEALSDALAGRP